MKLILISCESGEMNEMLRLEQMFRGGLETFHLRKPDWDLDKTAEFLDRLDAQYHGQVVLHDHYELTQRYKVRGVHLNERNKDKWDDYLTGPLQRSASFHSPEELESMPDMNCSYVFLSPVFPSISKAGYIPRYTEDELAAGLASTDIPVIALGGITPEKVYRCRKMGFAGVAVLGGIWNSADPFEQFHAIMNACQKDALTY